MSERRDVVLRNGEGTRLSASGGGAIRGVWVEVTGSDGVLLTATQAHALGAFLLTVARELAAEEASND